MAAIALFGLVAYRSLPVSDLPNVDFPTLLVTASLPGASPETMGASVATPLENQFSNIAGLESMTSVNSLGSTQVTLEFDLNRSLDGAAVDVQGAISQAARLLPQGMPTPPTFTKVNPADQPILYLVITSTHHAAVDPGRVRGDAHRAAHLDGERRGAGAGARRPEVRDARADRSARARRASDRDQRSRGRAQELERQHADRDHRRAAQGLHAPGQRPADERRAVQVDGRGVSKRRAGPARRIWARSSTASRISGPPRGSTRRTASSARSRSASSASPAPTPWRWPTPSRACCRSSAPSCRPASTWTCSTTAPTRFASRTATSSSPCS